MQQILGHEALAAGVDLKTYPWMQFALQKFRTQQPSRPTEQSDVNHFLNLVKDRSNGLKPVQHWTNHECTSWCSAFVNWCLTHAGYRGTNDALAESWLSWGEPSQPRWGAIAVVKVLPHGRAPSYHVGFFITQKLHSDGLYKYILGGNQRDHDRAGKLRSVNIDGHFGPKCQIACRMPKHVAAR